MNVHPWKEVKSGEYFQSLFQHSGTLSKEEFGGGKMNEPLHAVPTGANTNNLKVIAVLIIHGSPLVCADCTNREGDAGPGCPRN